MADETEVIRERMEETRTDLSDKIEQLENKVMGTVQDATTAVSDAVQSAKDVVESVKDSVEGTVESVKDAVEGTVDSVNQTVHDTVESVRQTFDLPRQVGRHPWLMVGGAVAVGFVAGRLLNYVPAAARTTGRMAESLRPTAERFTSAAASTAGAVGAAASTAGSWLGTLESMFGPEINKAKELAIGAMLGMVRDTAVQAAPEPMREQVREIIDGFTSKLGGKPVEGSVLGPKPSEEEVPNGPRSRF
jgi:ElaB/YqjD/DUF883 family membrane-anchored ribosome-binding protein